MDKKQKEQMIIIGEEELLTIDGGESETWRGIYDGIAQVISGVKIIDLKLITTIINKGKLIEI